LGQPVSASSLYRIGSVSKVFTDLLLVKLVDDPQNTLDLSTLISTIEPLFSIGSGGFDNRSISLEQLGSHMAGLSREGPCFPFSPLNVFQGCNVTSKEIYTRLRQNETMILPTETQPSYSNLGFACLGNALGRFTNNKCSLYDACLKQGFPPNTCYFICSVNEYIIEPLQLDAGFLYTPDLVWGFAESLPVPWFDLGWLAPAGQMYASAESLSKMLQYIMNNVFDEKSPLQLSSSLARKWLQPRYINADGNSGYGMPWEMKRTTTHDGSSYWEWQKGGYVPGFTTEVSMVADLRMSMALNLAAGPPTVASTLGRKISSIMVDALHHLNVKKSLPIYQLNPPGLNSDLLLGKYRMIASPLPGVDLSFLHAFTKSQSYHLTEINLSLHNVTIQNRQERVYHIHGTALNGTITALSRYMTFKTNNKPHPNTSHSNTFIFQTIPLPHDDLSTYQTSCTGLEGGEYFQTVFIRVLSNNRVQLELPGIFWGFVFEKD